MLSTVWSPTVGLWFEARLWMQLCKSCVASRLPACLSSITRCIATHLFYLHHAWLIHLWLIVKELYMWKNTLLWLVSLVLTSIPTPKFWLRRKTYPPTSKLYCWFMSNVHSFTLSLYVHNKWLILYTPVKVEFLCAIIFTLYKFCTDSPVIIFANFGIPYIEIHTKRIQLCFYFCACCLEHENKI